MKEIIGFFQDDLNSRSMSRLIAFMFSVWAIVASGFCFYVYGYAAGIATFSSISAIALTIKITSKSQESVDKKIETTK